MIRAVLDSNIHISAFNFGGPPEKVIRLAEAETFELFTSSFILNEVRRVLAAKFSWTVADMTAVEAILQLGRTVRPRERLNIVRDPDDNRILEWAWSS